MAIVLTIPGWAGPLHISLSQSVCAAVRYCTTICIVLNCVELVQTPSQPGLVLSQNLPLGVCHSHQKADNCAYVVCISFQAATEDNTKVIAIAAFTQNANRGIEHQACQCTTCTLSQLC